jgi:hypothetical protein
MVVAWQRPENGEHPPHLATLIAALMFAVGLGVCQPPFCRWVSSLPLS